jgi:hypothetical protein
MKKEKWKIETYWSMSSPLVFQLPSWKYCDRDLYLSEYIVTLRMRGYLFQLCKHCKGRGWNPPEKDDVLIGIIDFRTHPDFKCANCNGTGKDYQLDSVMVNNEEIVMSA